MTEREKMLAGELYDPNDPELSALRRAAHNLCKDYNDAYEDEADKRADILKKLLPQAGEGAYLQGPVYFDYGVFTKLGKNFYANFNFTVLDVCPVTIGNDVFIGPNVSILAAKHPLRWQERNAYKTADGKTTDKEYGAPVTIGDNCWLAGNVTVCAGATIGEGCVIGAGSVVTGHIPANSLAYGVPCRVARQITEADRRELKK